MPRAKKKQKQLDTENLMDLTPQEVQYSVQCEDIRLITSTLKPLIVDRDKDTQTRFAFRIRAVVDEDQAYSYLEVKANYFFEDAADDLQGFGLEYVLMGTFEAQNSMPADSFADFVKMYTLTILWPYAREYASDQFRRAGNHELVLPILNPQVVTQHIIEHDLVEVDILQSMPHA
jgi:preprotein translocase subunit SecB